MADRVTFDFETGEIIFDTDALRDMGFSGNITAGANPKDT